MDQTQEFWQEVQNAVAWEERSLPNSKLHVRSLIYETGMRTIWDTTGGDTLHNIQNDSIGPTHLWGWAQHVVLKHYQQHFLWPNIASLNQRITRYWYLNDTTTLNVVYHSGPLSAPPVMHRSHVQWADVTFKRSDPYTWGGNQPVGSASTERQENRYAALYRTHPASDTLGYTSREFFARQRPTGYMADGRSVVLRIDDAPHSGFKLQMHDVWVADDAGGRSAGFVPRGDDRAMIDSLPQVHALFRTRYFTTGDSTTIGCAISGSFHGDSLAGGASRVSGIVELVDSASGGVIQQLDSFAISASQPFYEIAVEPTLDLLSGTYYVRMRIASDSLPGGQAMGDSRYPIAEVTEFVANPGFGRLRRVSSKPEATARISAQPNPFGAATDVRFSIGSAGIVDVTVYDRLGREVEQLVRRAWMEPGRYEVAFETMDLEAGTYLIELRAGDVRVVTKVVRAV